MRKIDERDNGDEKGREIDRLERIKKERIQIWKRERERERERK